MCITCIIPGDKGAGVRAPRPWGQGPRRGNHVLVAGNQVKGARFNGPGGPSKGTPNGIGRAI